VIEVNFWWCGGGLALDWVYLCDFSSNSHKNWSAGNSLVVRDRCVLSSCGCSTVIASKTAMCDRDELGGGLHGLGRFLHFAMIVWAKHRELGRVTYTRWERGRGC
jgi:hypothetical protein